MNLPYSFSVVPQLPPKLEVLREISYNMWWSWNPDARQLFQELDPELWERGGHNPSYLLRHIEQRKLITACEDESYVQRLGAVTAQWKTYLHKPDRWFEKNQPDKKDLLVAYFSAEYGFHESLQNYSGGLGILAGDHCKSASDLGIPFVAVGLMYRQGYFTQHLNKAGWQESIYTDFDFHEKPVREVLGANGESVRVSVELPGRKVYIRAWEARIGLVRVFFLDTDFPENSEEDRRITFHLYGGNIEMRIKQEIVLGIGGKRFLVAMGLHPTVFHMNEGHAAFLALERIRLRMQEKGVGFYTALQAVAASNLFTTHTPVPAGNDAFSPELMQTYFSDYISELKIKFEEFLKFGRPWESRPNEPFSMTILALRMSRFANAVSRIHGEVSRTMWQSVWPRVPVHEVPIGHITNGIHTQTWIAPEIKSLVEQQVGDFWESDLSDSELWRKVHQIPDEQLWWVHLKLKKNLVEFAQTNIRTQRLRVQDSAKMLHEVHSILDPQILTIGFSRRFATYKRATLFMRDTDRLLRLINHPEYPVQFVFAGKAHPADEGGKKLIQEIYQLTRRHEFRNRIVFLENYDINVARHIYQGVDVWLNNPTRPLEASGTSGQKVAPNGAINLSVLDGWWAEAWRRNINGWAIGEQLNTNDAEVQNDFDAESFYSLLEHEIAPLYYDWENGLPKKWIQWMKNSMCSISPVYSTFRQVQDYTRHYYLTAFEKGQLLSQNQYEGARQLAEWKERIRSAWTGVKIIKVNYQTKPVRSMTVGEMFPVEVQIELGKLTPEDVLVEVYAVSDAGGGNYVIPLTHQSEKIYTGMVEARESGRYQFNIRVLPHHPLLVQKHELRLITWAE